jgi:hypothetical protein
VDDRFFNHLTFNTDVFLRNADGTGEVQLTFDDHIDDDPAWSPDGTQITFSSTRGGSYDIYVIDVPPPAGAGLAARRATDLAAGEEPPVIQLTDTPGFEENPDWGGEDQPPTFTLTVQRAGTGTGVVRSQPAGITCGSDCTESYQDGAKVRLVAKAKPGSSFAGWTGACRPVSPTACVAKVTEGLTVTATFNTA